VFRNPEKVFWNQNEIICIEYYPVYYITDIINPHKILPNIPSLKKIERDTQNYSPGQEMKQKLD
jgi:hypothetical protein